MTVRKVRRRVFCKPMTREEWERDNREYLEALTEILGSEQAHAIQEQMWKEIEAETPSLPPEGGYVEVEMVELTRDPD